MADMQPPGTPSGWAGLLYFAAITLITIAAEYLRRIMPPPRKSEPEHQERPDYDDREYPED